MTNNIQDLDLPFLQKIHTHTHTHIKDQVKTAQDIDDDATCERAQKEM